MAMAIQSTCTLLPFAQMIRHFGTKRGTIWHTFVALVRVADSIVGVFLRPFLVIVTKDAFVLVRTGLSEVLAKWWVSRWNFDYGTSISRDIGTSCLGLTASGFGRRCRR